MDARVGASAGIGFVVVGAVELALTGGPASAAGAVDEAVAFFTAEAGAASAVAVLSAVAAALLLVFAASLRAVVDDPRLADLAWGGAIAMVALALAGQAVQQTAWIVGGELSASTLGALGGLVSLLFAFALVGGAVLAVAASFGAARHGHLPTWLAVLATLAAGVIVAGVADTAVSEASFPAFLVWLLATSGVLLRRGPSTAESPDHAATRTG